MGITVALIQGKVAMGGIHFAPVWPTFVPPLFIRSKPERRGTALPGDDGIAKRPGVATMKASGYQLPVSPLMIFTGLLALLLSPFGVYSICIAAITAAICQSPDAHPDPTRRWLAAAAAGVFIYLPGGLAVR